MWKTAPFRPASLSLPGQMVASWPRGWPTRASYLRRWPSRLPWPAGQPLPPALGAAQADPQKAVLTLTHTHTLTGRSPHGGVQQGAARVLVEHEAAVAPRRLRR